ncbi:LHFPL tetraspan subfamily member 6 protein-like [Frieseomelitta varia]|nr:LHFPL tetraspan subfamily member 6 protein-like [Frieseomelitta varia]
MICGGLVMYPIGWDNREVRESCGKGANVYNLGKCSVSWSSHLLVGSVALLMLCFGLSFCAARHKPSNPHTDPLRI